MEFFRKVAEMLIQYEVGLIHTNHWNYDNQDALWVPKLDDISYEILGTRPDRWRKWEVFNSWTTGGPAPFRPRCPRALERFFHRPWFSRR